MAENHWLSLTASFHSKETEAIPIQSIQVTKSVNNSARTRTQDPSLLSGPIAPDQATFQYSQVLPRI